MINLKPVRFGDRGGGSWDTGFLLEHLSENTGWRPDDLPIGPHKGLGFTGLGVKGLGVPGFSV